MGESVTFANQILVSTSVISAAFALTLASVGIGTPQWQINTINTTYGEILIVNTANFFYACRYNLAGEILECGERIRNRSISSYYRINTTGDEDQWNLHLNTAAGFSIIGLILIFIATVAIIFMFFGEKHQWIYLVTPVLLFVACLFMLAALAEGSQVLFSNGYSAYLYRVGHLLTIFSLLVNSIVAGRMFQYELLSKPSQNVKNQLYKIVV